MNAVPCLLCLVLSWVTSESHSQKALHCFADSGQGSENWIMMWGKIFIHPTRAQIAYPFYQNPGSLQI